MHKLCNPLKYPPTNAKLLCLECFLLSYSGEFNRILLALIDYNAVSCVESNLFNVYQWMFRLPVPFDFITDAC